MKEQAQNATRWHSLDVIRGVAVLGILLMNIHAFAMPQAAYLNPTAFGDFSGINRLVWGLSHLMVEGKFIALFALLFGAGIWLFCQQAEARYGQSLSLHLRRMCWLLLLGLLHAYLIWQGDVLAYYAICGVGVYFFRNFNASTLWRCGFLFLVAGALLWLLNQWQWAALMPADLTRLQSSWQPEPTQLAVEIAAYQGDWQAQLAWRVRAAWQAQTVSFITIFIWPLTGLMLIGMACCKQGLFSRPSRTDLLWQRALLYCCSGYAVTGLGMFYNLTHDFQFEPSALYGTCFNAVGSLVTALGYLYLMLWLIQQNAWAALRLRLAAVGQLALTHYLSQSLICTSLFYGFGLGLFAALERWQLALLALLMGGVQLLYSPLWLSYFGRGPFEWGWRSLTYRGYTR